MPGRSGLDVHNFDCFIIMCQHNGSGDESLTFDFGDRNLFIALDWHDKPAGHVGPA